MNYACSAATSCDFVQSDSFGWPTRNASLHTEFTGIMSLFERKKIKSLAHGTLMLAERLKYVEWTAEIFRIRYNINITDVHLVHDAR